MSVSKYSFSSDHKTCPTSEGGPRKFEERSFLKAHQSILHKVDGVLYENTIHKSDFRAVHPTQNMTI